MKSLALLTFVALANPAIADSTVAPSRLDAHDSDARWHDAHREAPPHEDATPSPRVKSALKRALDWPAPTGEQYGETAEPTRGQTRDEKRARTEPRNAPR